jgi:hypothetical protein
MEEGQVCKTEKQHVTPRIYFQTHSRYGTIGAQFWRRLMEHPGNTLSHFDSRDACFHPQKHGRTTRKIFHQILLVSWTIVFTKQAQQHLDIVAKHPFYIPPPYEKLIGDLA